MKTFPLSSDNKLVLLLKNLRRIDSLERQNLNKSLVLPDVLRSELKNKSN